MKLPDLIAKLETAKTGHRELDDAIWAIERGYKLRWNRGARPSFLVPSCMCTEHAPGAPHWQELGPGEGGPHYTTSMDAAVTLVPEGYFWTIDCSGYAGIRPLDSEGSWTHADGATPALAICIAALKARTPNTG